jgi:hypothetical protein
MTSYAADPTVVWGWFRKDDKGSGNIEWLRGTLAETFDRARGANLTVASNPGGNWIVVSSNPIEAYREVMAETARFARKEGE